MAEKQIEGKVLGVAFDGTGYGDDGTLWGGEFLICDYKKYKRVAHLKEFKLLGGTKAIKEPRRVALSLLFDLYGEDAINLKSPTIEAFSASELKTQYLMWQKNLNSPLSSSMGRLFDAISSLTGICQVMSFEGESGMLLEELYDERITDSYQITYQDEKIEFLEMIREITKEQNQKVAISKFFNTVVEIINTLYRQYNLPLVLSGGVFQNRVLLELILKKIPKAVLPSEIPPNDGGISLGQIVSS
jgi:hydrogenase maturation protein HypF